MTMNSEMSKAQPEINIHIAERGDQTIRGWQRCQIGENVRFSTERLETYCFTNWRPIIYDALLVAATVEFADKTLKRFTRKWDRRFQLRIPVHDADRWNDKQVHNALLDALEFLTGDYWQITFTQRSEPEPPPSQCRFELGTDLLAVMPYSDGLDSRAVAGLVQREMGNKLIRVRLGLKADDSHTLSHQGRPFASVPYHVRAGDKLFQESSSRSRGFKFALLGGLAAHLANVSRIVVAESGQGALGPALVTVGQSYEDYRSHPLFMRRMERLINALFETDIHFEFPRLWFTKGETLAAYIQECGSDAAWAETRSCWQQSRQVSVNHSRRQCGICAACLLRRMSVHAAGLTEPEHTYVWEYLAAPDFRAAAVREFDESKITGKMREYAIAGVLHLDHLAGILHSEANMQTLNLNAFQLSNSMNITVDESLTRLTRLLVQHGKEWKNFVNSLGANSFLADWASQEGL
jgi:hypothetical protein